MDNCDLSKLTVKPGKLVPKFSPKVTEYTVTLPTDVAETKFGPLTSDNGASYTIKGIAGGEKTLKLDEGQAVTVAFEVTAEDGKSTKAYEVTVRRLSPDDASLASLDLSMGGLSPKFSSLKLSYTCHVPCSVDSLSVKAKPEDASMKVTFGNGSPLSPVALAPGATRIDVAVSSPKGTKTVHYIIKVVRNAIQYPMTFTSGTDHMKYACTVCCNTVHRPLKMKESTQLYCHACCMELTRTNKTNPFTGESLVDDWSEECFDIDQELASSNVRCILEGNQKVEGTASEIGKLVRHTRTLKKEEDPSINCPQCSCKFPAVDKSLHENLICSSKHPAELPKHHYEVSVWEKQLRKETGEDKSDPLMKEAESFEKSYLKMITSVSVTSRDSPIGPLTNAMSLVAAAIKTTPKNAQYHVKLGNLLEESFYVGDMYGIKEEKQENEEPEEGEDRTTDDSKEDDFLAICQLRGVGPGAPLALQLKAVEAEYLALKDGGQTMKAEQVQLLYAWKSKRALQESQGSYSGESVGPLARALQKYRDAVGVSPTNHLAQYHLGRLLLLVGKSPEALPHLKAAVAAKPGHTESRLCLGIAMATEKQSVPEAAVLLREGLAEYQSCASETAETKVDATRGTLLADDFWRQSNLLISKGFIELARLGGRNWLDKQTCLLLACRFVWTVPFHHRGTTYKQLLWYWAEARYILQRCSPKDVSLELCCTFSSLLDHVDIDATQRLSEMKLNTCRDRVSQDPWSSEALYLLGRAQSSCFEAKEDDPELLNSAEKSFRASIACEGKSSAQDGTPNGLSTQEWWKKKVAGDVKSNTSAAKNVSSTPKSGSTAKTGANPPVASVKKGPTSQKAPTKPVASSKSSSQATPTGKMASNTKTPTSATKGPVAKTPIRKGQSRPCDTKAKNVAATADTNAQQKQSITSPKPTTASSQPSQTQKEANPTIPDSAAKKKIGIINKKSYNPRLGLARVLIKKGGASVDEAVDLYKEVISMAPHVHDAYIELGEVLVKKSPLEAVEIYSKFPFSSEESFDDGYLYGEISRILLAEEKFGDPWLQRSLIALGRVLGIGVLEKQFAVLEAKFQTNLLKNVTAGIHGKPVDDSSLQAFFKYKCWI